MHEGEVNKMVTYNDDDHWSNDDDKDLRIKQTKRQEGRYHEQKMSEKEQSNSRNSSKDRDECRDCDGQQ